MQVVIGLDISTAVVGYSVLDIDTLQIIDCGFIELNKEDTLFKKIDFCLKKLFEIIINYSIFEFIIEAPLEVATGTNSKSAFLLNRINSIISYELYRNGFTVKHIASQKARKYLMGDQYRVWFKLKKGDAKKEFIAKLIQPMVEHLVKFEYRPRATDKFKPKYYDLSDACVIALSFRNEK